MTRLSLGPLLLYWPAEEWRDFYFRIADEAPVDSVYLGEIVCAKRAPFLLPHFPEVIERLQAAGKEVVYAAPILMTDRQENALLDGLLEMPDALIEANDVAALTRLKGRAHAIGPMVNVYNEETLRVLAEQGAVRVTLPVELPRRSLAVLAGAAGAAGTEVEVQVFGRAPLAISARCYHARAYGRTKDSCQYACGEDPDGLTVETLDAEPFLTINGVQTQSHAYGCLLAEIPEMIELGVAGFRLSPQHVDMVAVAQLYRAVIEGRCTARPAVEALVPLIGEVPLSNGFYHGLEGVRFV